MFNYIKYQSQVFINNILVIFSGIAMFRIPFIIHPAGQHFETGHTPGIKRLRAFHEIFP